MMLKARVTIKQQKETVHKATRKVKAELEKRTQGKRRCTLIKSTMKIQMYIRKQRKVEYIEREGRF